MRRWLDAATRVSVILLVGQALVLQPSALQAAPPSSPADSVDLARVGSLSEMQNRLDALYGEALRAREGGRFTFELQEKILKKSGESISKILELEKGARLSDPKVSKAYETAFEKNDAILRFIIRCNEEEVDRLQEEKLDKVEDEQAFLDSPEWQMPHRLISLSRYWMSWSGYYRSFLCSAEGEERNRLLGEAIAGFSLTLLDIADPTIVAKGLFGRALCFKEMGDDEKAAKDLRAITENVRHNDPLYMWSLYEQALICYRAGRHEAALAHLEKLDTEIEEKTLSEVLGNEPRKLRERVVLEPRAKALLERIEKEADKRGEGARTLCLKALTVLKRLSAVDADYATKLYRLVEAHPFFFDELPCEEVGTIGCLALADDRFKQGEYPEAAKRYRSLWSSSDVYLRNRKDDIYFRTMYAYCQTGRWKEALASYDELCEKAPQSGLTGKAACLEYVAAAGNYKQAPSRSTYLRYVESTKRYLLKCPNPRDRNGAHFFLGKDYEQNKKTAEARREFSAVEPGSPQYWPARYYLLNYDVQELERRARTGKGRGADTKRLYREMALQFERFQSLLKNREVEQSLLEIAPPMTILQARMFRSGPEGSCDKAMQALDGFEKRFPKSRSLWLAAMRLRLECCRDGEMFDQAGRQIESLLQAYPVDRDLWDFLAEWAAAYDEEAKRLRDAGKSEPADACEGLALKVYEGMASIASRHASYQEHLEVVQFRMAEILMAQGETERAGRLYREILKRSPDAADVLSKLGEIYEAQGRWDDALELWRRYEKGVEPGSPAWLDCRYRIALAHSKMGRGKEACEVLTMVRVLHPDAGDEAFRRKIRDLETKVCANGGPPP